MADDRKDVAAENTTTELDGGRRKFLTNLATVAVTAGAIVASQRGKSVKSRVIARIQEEMDSEYLDDPLQYHTSGYSEYSKELDQFNSGGQN